eukprot:PhF_6_TR21154/c0_g1_i1/m.30458
MFGFNLIKSNYSSDMVIQPPPLFGHTLAANFQGNAIILFGGCSAKGVSNQVYTFQILKSSWTRRPPSRGGNEPQPRYRHTAVLGTANRLIYVFGGIGSGRALFDDLWLFSPDSETWTEVKGSGTTPGPRCAHACCMAPDGFHMYVCGGYDAQGETLDDMYVYATSSEVWRKVDIPGFSDRACHGGFLAGGRWFIGGGVGPLTDTNWGNAFVGIDVQNRTHTGVTVAMDGTFPRKQSYSIVPWIEDKKETLKFVVLGGGSGVNDDDCSAVTLDYDTTKNSIKIGSVQLQDPTHVLRCEGLSSVVVGMNVYVYGGRDFLTGHIHNNLYQFGIWVPPISSPNVQTNIGRGTSIGIRGIMQAQQLSNKPKSPPPEDDESDDDEDDTSPRPGRNVLRPQSAPLPRTVSQMPKNRQENLEDSNGNIAATRQAQQRGGTTDVDEDIETNPDRKAAFDRMLRDRDLTESVHTTYRRVVQELTDLQMDEGTFANKLTMAMLNVCNTRISISRYGVRSSVSLVAHPKLSAQLKREQAAAAAKVLEDNHPSRRRRNTQPTITREDLLDDEIVKTTAVHRPNLKADPILMPHNKHAHEVRGSQSRPQSASRQSTRSITHVEKDPYYSHLISNKAAASAVRTMPPNIVKPPPKRDGESRDRLIPRCKPLSQATSVGEIMEYAMLRRGLKAHPARAGRQLPTFEATGKYLGSRPPSAK